MKKVLEDLYFGEIQPNFSSFEDNPHLKKCIQIVDENEVILSKLLKGKERKLFLELIDAQSEAESTTTAESFIDGFKLGARIVAESLIEL